MKTLPKTKPIGAVLCEAGLVSEPQIQVALRDQAQCNNLPIGEILALRGWIKQETADFFAREWRILLAREKTEPIGQYFKKAGLLDERQIQDILSAQKEGQTWIRFGALAVFKGYIKQSTLEFFLKYLIKDFRSSLSFIAQGKQIAHSNDDIYWELEELESLPDYFTKTSTGKFHDNEEIPWID